MAWAGERAWTRSHRAGLCNAEYEPPPAGMVFVAAGEFWMGSDDASAEPDERPLRRVFVPAFYIDKFEVTNRRYKEFKRNHQYPPGEDDLPVTFVFKHEAEEFCRWAGKRLPTSAEWEKAARGTGGQHYPWGDKFQARCANISWAAQGDGINAVKRKPPASASGKLPPGSLPLGVSPYGCHDMAGNVWEWVSDIWFDRNILGFKQATEGRGILRGGAYNYSPLQARTSYQGFEALGATCHDVGFRCAMTAIPKRMRR